MKGFLARMTSKGQVTVPKQIRDHLGLTKDSTLEFLIHGDGKVLVQNHQESDILDQALNHPIINSFISNHKQGELRASMYIGALIQSGVLSRKIIESLKDSETIEKLFNEWKQ